MREIEIMDIGPVERLTIPIPEEGGVVCLVGSNGSGKSLACQAVQALLGNGKPVSRDGSLGATVQGLGARLTVGRRASRSGELEIAHLEGQDPSLLVDPGLKDPAAADAQRIRTLLTLARAEVDPLEFAALVGGENQLRELCRESSLAERDIPAMAAAIKRDLEAAARKYESESKNLGARAQGVLQTLDDLLKQAGADERVKAADVPDSETAQREHEAAVRKLSEAEGARETTRRLFAAASEASIALNEIGDKGTPDRIAELEEKHRTASDRIVTLQQQLRDAERAMEAATLALSEHRQAQKQRESLQRTIAQAEGVESISDAELSTLRSRVDETRALIESAAIIDRSAGLRGEARRLQEQAQSAAVTGSELRMAAQATDRIVTEAVAKVCGDDMKVSDGRLLVRHTRGWIPFAELSHGERYRIAIDVSVAAVGEGGILTLRQEGWESLDPMNRAAVAEHARKRRTVILTAEADSGEIRAEVAQ